MPLVQPGLNRPLIATGTSLPGMTAMCRDAVLVYENRRWASPLGPKADLTGPSQQQ